MKFEEVLPALREGKAVQRVHQAVPWAYLTRSPGGGFHWYGYDPTRLIPMALNHDDVMAVDWVIVDPKTMAPPRGTHFCRRRMGIDDGSKPDHYRQIGTDRERCSYCGSCSGDSFMAFVESGGEVLPTDKNYKVYLDGETRPCMKFYFQHLSEDQQNRFIELLNQNQVNIGVPGHFYNLPYFAKTQH